jgi:NAD(P)H-dependent flavin oxidoreductase YrpB (nitropropane dioxygenase family)
MRFCQRYGLRIPILQAPMAGSCPVSLAIAVAEAGGMGAPSIMGLYSSPFVAKLRIKESPGLHAQRLSLKHERRSAPGPTPL